MQFSLRLSMRVHVCLGQYLRWNWERFGTYVFDDFWTGGGFELELDDMDDGHFGSVYRLRLLGCDISTEKWSNADNCVWRMTKVG